MSDRWNNGNADEPKSKIGPDATAMFDYSASDLTAHASSKVTYAATAVNGEEEDEELEEEDDDAAAFEEDDEEDEEQDVEDEADA